MPGELFSQYLATLQTRVAEKEPWKSLGVPEYHFVYSKKDALTFEEGDMKVLTADAKNLDTKKVEAICNGQDPSKDPVKLLVCPEWASFQASLKKLAQSHSQLNHALYDAKGVLAQLKLKDRFLVQYDNLCDDYKAALTFESDLTDFMAISKAVAPNDAEQVKLLISQAATNQGKVDNMLIGCRDTKKQVLKLLTLKD